MTSDKPRSSSESRAEVERLQKEVAELRNRWRACERAHERGLATYRRADGILESISDAFFALDRERRFTYVNRRAEQFWSRRRKELLGKRIWEVFPQATDSRIFQEMQRAMQERVTTGFEAVSPVTGLWVSGRAYPTPDGGLSVYFQDITERKQAEAGRENLVRELETGRARLETILQQMPGGTFVAEPSGKIILGNEEAAQIYRQPFEPVESFEEYTR